MATVSISEAARLAEKGRATLQRHIKAGKLSVGKDALGNPVIDTAELFRVYKKPSSASKNQMIQAQDTPKKAAKGDTPSLEVLKEQLRAAHEREEWLKKQLESLQERHHELERRLLPPGQEKKGLWARIFG